MSYKFLLNIYVCFYLFVIVSYAGKCSHCRTELGTLCRTGPIMSYYRCTFSENLDVLWAASEAKCILWSSDARVSVFPSGECGGRLDFLQRQRYPG